MWHSRCMLTANRRFAIVYVCLLQLLSDVNDSSPWRPQWAGKDVRRRALSRRSAVVMSTQRWCKTASNWRGCRLCLRRVAECGTNLEQPGNKGSSDGTEWNLQQIFVR